MRKPRSRELLALVRGRRWAFLGGREPESAEVTWSADAGSGVLLALVLVRFPDGTHETYALALRRDAGGRLVDALDDATGCRRLASLAGVETPCETVRSMGVEQSNSSTVLDEAHVLKLYRRLEPGPNPELEVLRMLRGRGFPNVPPLEGWIEHVGAPLETTLAIVTGFVPSHGGGWELALATLREGDPDWLPLRARRLGEVTGALHAALASDPDDPQFAPEQPSAEALPLLVASIDEDIERTFAELGPLPELEPLRGRAEEVRDVVQSLGGSGRLGLAVRTHGDYHLGQVLWTTDGDWVVIDFEGEPVRRHAERRRRQPVLRDVAGMLRSFSYAERASALVHGAAAPEGWVDRCREEFLDGYRSTVDPRLLPASEAGADRLLALFELEKLLYELRYELAGRPAWAAIPVDGILDLLEHAW